MAEMVPGIDSGIYTLHDINGDAIAFTWHI